MASTLLNCTPPALQLIQKTTLSHYPSASALVSVKEGIYILGDDATKVLLLDADHQIHDSIPLFESIHHRIKKKEKVDFESAALINKEGKRYLLAVGSFSTPARCRLGWINLTTKKLERLDTVALMHTGLTSINIEACAFVDDILVLGNRANNSFPSNHLLLLKWKRNGAWQQLKADTIQLNLSNTRLVKGLSDLYYHSKKDWLIFTASTEDAADAYSDGAISGSYIGVIKEASKKLSGKQITPDDLIDLQPILKEKSPQKIEGITIGSDTNGELILHLAADNDDGQSSLFKLRWRI